MEAIIPESYLEVVEKYKQALQKLAEGEALLKDIYPKWDGLNVLEQIPELPVVKL